MEPNGDGGGASARSRILSIISHDIRAPLGVILGAVSELVRPPAATGAGAAAGPLTDDQRTLVQLVRRSSEKLVRLAANVSLVQRIDEGAVLAGPRARADLRDIARRALDSFERSGELARLTAALLVPDARADVEADLDSASVAVVNLIANAVRFARARITVTVVSSADGRVVQVEDDGPGLPADFAHDLFTPGKLPHQGGRTMKGLGLHVVRAVAEAHGATVTFETISDERAHPVGTRARVTFPMPP